MSIPSFEQLVSVEDHTLVILMPKQKVSVHAKSPFIGNDFEALG
jgi:hypothetical protein